MPTKPLNAEPTWDIAHLFPLQGAWSEEDYLALNTNHLIELSNGELEVLPMPSQQHQRIVFFLAKLLDAFINLYDLGEMIIAPFRINLWQGKFREPDIMFLFKKNFHKRGEQYWLGADLVIEVVSPDDPKRDTEKKYAEYARAGIREYWIVNPMTQTVSVFTLPQDKTVYQLHSEAKLGESASSELLSGFVLDARDIFTQSTQQ